MLKKCTFVQGKLSLNENGESSVFLCFHSSGQNSFGRNLTCFYNSLFKQKWKIVFDFMEFL